MKPEEMENLTFLIRSKSNSWPEDLATSWITTALNNTFHSEAQQGFYSRRLGNLGTHSCWYLSDSGDQPVE